MNRNEFQNIASPGDMVILDQNQRRRYPGNDTGIFEFLGYAVCRNQGNPKCLGCLGLISKAFFT